MAETAVLAAKELPEGAKRVVSVGEAEILLIHHAGAIVAVQSKCPHAGATLEKGAVCNGRLVCPWHMGTFALPSGALIEPPPMQALKTYPVRVEGDQIMLDADPIALPQTGSYQNSTEDTRHFLLVGFGAAGAMAASTLRREGFTGKITAFDPVADEPVDRTQLSKQALAGKMPPEKTQLHLAESLHVDHQPVAVKKLSAAEKSVTLASGEVVHFDAALVASGGVPKRLEIPGCELAYTIRHTDDVRSILAKAEKAKNVVVIGTSFIGLEAASALTQKGLHVTVIGPEELPFANKFGNEVAAAIKAFHEKSGTRFRLSVEIVSIHNEGVHAMDTKKKAALGLIPADLVIFGVGVSPELGFEHDLPEAEKGGIKAGEDLRAADGVWVAGDIASVNGTRIEHWRLAEQHGQLAARRMLGNSAGYDSVPFFWTFHYGKRLGYLGHANEWDRITYDGAVEELNFLAYYVKDGKVAAVLSCGRDTDTAKLSEILRSKPTLEEARHLLTAQ